MPKNSRPDIQVLEERIVRLKAQLLEYKDIRLYSSTKRKLSAVSDELQECMLIINDIVTTSTNNISSSSMSALDDSGMDIPEFSEDCDLIDTELLPSTVDEQYSARQIVSTYSTRIKNAAESIGCNSGVIQTNQFWKVLDTWYQNRFTPAVRNPDFHFKANRIHEWIDLLIIAAGHSLRTGQFSKFVSDMNAWSTNLNTPDDEAWILPYSVMQVHKSYSAYCTKEAVLLEKMVKTFLYDNTFYPNEKQSVKRIVIENTRYSPDDLTVGAILASCPKLVRTSSFDITKYQEGHA